MSLELCGLLWLPGTAISKMCIRDSPVSPTIPVRLCKHLIAPIVLSANGRIKPDAVVINGKEERHPH